MSDDLSGFSLLDLFRSEADTHCQTLSTGLLALEGGDYTPSMIEPLMRAAHSIKGAARIVGLDDAVRLAHAMEDVFVGVQEGRGRLFGRHVDLLLKSVDALTRLAGGAESPSSGESSVEDLIAALDGVLQDQSPETPQPATAVEEVAPPQSASSTGSLADFSLIELFRSEAESLLSVLSDGLLVLEQGGSLAGSLLESMMRAAHSLKGAARIVGLEPAVKVAHAMEDVFVAVQEGKCTVRAPHVDVLLRGVDLLTRISQLPEAEVGRWWVENDQKVDSVVAEILSILTAKDAGPSAPPKAAPPPEPATPEPPKSALAAVVPEPEPGEPPPARSVPEPAAPAPAAEQADRVVRVTAESLTRLMSLAGESLVQSRQLRPFVDSLLSIKKEQSSLLSLLQTIEQRTLSSGAAAPVVEPDLLGRLRAQAGMCAQMLGEKMEQFEDFARRSEDLSGRLHHEVLTSRMRPMADGVRGFPRLVRDISRKLDKQVQFRLVGETTGVDRDILEKLEAPLNHLIRNALDHAIETPAERQAAGKPAVGTIKLEARHRAGMLQITLSDDGRGVDPARLRSKVVERGLATPSMASKLTDAELLEFMFLPGFSTKEKVTEISGRGVGLDVVQSMVREVGGVVRVTSQVGQGTRFTLQLPITMSVIRALLVRVGGEPYAFPLNRIDRILMLPKSDILVLEGRQHFLMDGQHVGLVDSCQVLELNTGNRSNEMLAVVVASDRSHRFGVVVDAFLGERDIEVRPLDPRLGKVPNINSASVLEDGWPVLIFDVEDLVRSIDNMLSGRRLGRISEAREAVTARGPRRILVVDDSITVRELERQLLESHGYSVEIAVDGVDGWNAVRSGEYDLVVSDVDMPRMDGIQFVTLIKQEPQFRSMPVIIVSYKDREEDRMRGLDAGANAYLTKSSFHDKTFLQTVIDLIGEATA